MCLSLLWIGALGPSILPIGELCVIVWEAVCVCMRARCPQSTLLILLCSVSDTLSGFGGSPLVSLVLCLLHLFTPPKHSQIYYPPLSLFLYFSLSVDLSYLLLTSLDLSFQISSCVVVRWCACRQPAPVSSSAGDRIEFLSQPSS